jgi:threonine aldolase
MRTWTGPGVDLEAIEALVAPDLGPFIVRTAALSVENTHNFGGGMVLPIADLRRLRALADRLGLGVHLDGARIWNAHAVSGVTFGEYGEVADVVTVCLSKGLGAPVGSLMIGSEPRIAEARAWRKRLGAGWRQAGVLAAAGLYALDHHTGRLDEDHRHARQLAEAARLDPSTVETNIVVVRVADAAALLSALRDAGVLASVVGPRAVRLVTHLDVDDADTATACRVLRRLVS